METQLLRAFLTVADQQSVSKAAERLHLTQPAISKQVQSLESQLGIALVDRIGRRLNLTEAGRIFMPRAQAILQQLEESQRELRNLHAQVSGPLTLATSHHIGLHRLPPVLRRYAEAYPQVDLQIEFLDSEAAYAQVLQGRFELAIITLAPEIDPRLDARLLWSDRLRFVAAPHHPLASRRRLSLQQLAQHRATLPDLSTYTGQIVERLFAGAGIRLNRGMATNYLETLKMMVSIGLGWSLLPQTMVDAGMVPLDVAVPPIERPLGVILHRARSLSNAARIFLELLIDSADRSEAGGNRG